MIIALAQMNAVIGDFEGNARRVLDFARIAAHAPEAGICDPAIRCSGPRGQPDLLVFPEMALCGYPPMDLLDQDSFVEGCLGALRRLQRELPRGMAVAVGYVDSNRYGSGKPLVNAVAVIQDGRIAFTQAKTLLPSYDVFDEARYFEPARERRFFELKGAKIGFAICEDLWYEAPPVAGLRYEVDPVKELLDLGADLIVVPSASPYHAGKLDVRLRLAGDAARGGGVPLLYCNLLGGNDSLVFDGRSFVFDARGRLSSLAGWEEEILFADTAALEESSVLSGSSDASILARASMDRYEELERALVLGIRDYLRKCGFASVCLGLSGGIDSALVAYLSAMAIGPEKVTCISMPSRFSSEGSITDSVELCENLGMPLESLPIEGPFSAYLELLAPAFEGKPFGLAEENLQARVRGALLMAWSNKFGALLMTTGNKSELAAGYCTLYGDMCGALAPIGDLWKTEVFGLCNSINERAIAKTGNPIIPLSTLTKPPSAELRPNQTDQDSLPPYETLDAILSLYIVENRDARDIISRGFEPAIVERVIGMVARAEYKRRQAAPVIKISPRAFGTGRRIPIARFVHEARRA